MASLSGSAPPQWKQLLDLMIDGKARSITEIHRHIGFCRLNSRVADLRRPEYGGYTILHWQEGRVHYYRLVNSLEPGEATGFRRPRPVSPDSSERSLQHDLRAEPLGEPLGASSSEGSARSNPPGLAALAAPSTPSATVGAFPQTSASPGHQLTLDVAV